MPKAKSKKTKKVKVKKIAKAKLPKSKLTKNKVEKIKVEKKAKVAVRRKKKKDLKRLRLGNFLIVFSLALILWVYFPFINLYLNPPKINPKLISSKGYYIEIPRIGAQSPIVLGVDPWNSNVYKPQLEKGVAQAKGTSLPGEKGTTYLFAHSSDYPWNIGRYNIVFFRLGEVKIGDPIIIFKNGKKISYKVTDKKVVWPNDIKYLKDISKTQLILQTCTPIGTDFQRLLVFAKPQ